ncbi:MAG TPA: hypothetical protein VGN72_19750 [Tepidisphaeraceae bacterium]|jgi:hypothetical protein|nr:hypothetical protein [Tepidisphaeraceae bacterium]
MNFLYFVPTRQKSLTKAKLAELGLGYAIDENTSIGNQDAPRGPGDQSGLIVSLPRKGGKASATLYKPDAQVWKPGPEARYWVGLNKGERPGPDDLCRANLIGGEPVKLRDGRAWTVPIARSAVGGSTLPKELVLSDDGHAWVEADLAEYFALSNHAARLFPLFYGIPLVAPASGDGADGEADGEGESTTATEEPPELPWQEATDMAVDAMAINYRLSRIEASMLRLFSTATVRDVLQALVDLPNFRRVMIDRRGNELASETSSIGDGSEATCPNTSPATAT